MKNKLTSLLRKVFLGSLAGIATSNSGTAKNTTLEFSPDEDENKVESRFNKMVDLSPKLLLKMGSNDEWNFVSHRSHRSHSSHRSHYSSYSGGSSQPKSNSGVQPNYNDSKSGTTTTTTALKLGSRTLKRGMSGTDVTELVNILLRKQYLTLEDGGTRVTGEYTYDEIIEGAVKKFQTNSGLESDGICGSTTIYYLKNK